MKRILNFSLIILLIGFILASAIGTSSLMKNSLANQNYQHSSNKTPLWVEVNKTMRLMI
ncbi:hypothetical protein OAO18_07645 [Francisellaceae bacterium]|nr:hypothetical protein [Francisellaceae bacterium]